MKDSDFIVNGYNKYHLWTMLFYRELVSPQNQSLNRKEITKKALNIYLELLGFKK